MARGCVSTAPSKLAREKWKLSKHFRWNPWNCVTHAYTFTYVRTKWTNINLIICDTQNEYSVSHGNSMHTHTHTFTHEKRKTRKKKKRLRKSRVTILWNWKQLGASNAKHIVSLSQHLLFSYRTFFLLFLLLLELSSSTSRPNHTQRIWVRATHTLHWSMQAKKAEAFFSRSFGRIHESPVTRWLAQDITVYEWMDEWREWYVLCYHYLCTGALLTCKHCICTIKYQWIHHLGKSYDAKWTESSSRGIYQIYTLLASVFYSHFAFSTFYFVVVVDFVFVAALCVSICR